MNFIMLMVLVFTVLPVVIGLLVGLIRGFKRSLARTVVTVVCIILAGLLCGPLGNALTNMKMPGTDMTGMEYLCNTLTEAMQGVDLSEILVPLVQSIVKVVSYILLFLLLLLLTWIIVSPICNAIFRHGEKRKEKVRRHRLFGGLIGLVQGAAVAVALCMAVSGLLTQVGKVAVMANDLSSETTEGSEQGADEQFSIMQTLTGYPESGIAVFYDKLTGKPFEWISTVPMSEGKNTNLPALVDSLSGAVQMAKEMIKLSNMDFADIILSGNFEDLQEILKNLDDIKSGMSDDALATLNILINSLSQTNDLPVDLSGLDISEVEFLKEGSIISDLYDYTRQDVLTEEQADEIVGKIGESSLALPIIEGCASDISDNLTEEQTQSIRDAIDRIEDNGTLSEDKIERLRNIFG